MQFWPIPRDWEGKTVAIFAGGPSLTLSQVLQCKEAGLKLVTINNAYSLAPFADMHYFCDGRWFKQHEEVMLKTCKGEIVTLDENIGRQYPDRVKCVQNVGFDRDKPEQTDIPSAPHQIRHGHNGGYQSLQIVAKRGVKRILLLGYDMKAKDGVTHWHGNHGFRIADPNVYANLMVPAIRTLAPHLQKAGIEVINCTPDSALDCFEKMDLCHALSALSGTCPTTEERRLSMGSWLLATKHARL